MYVFENLSEKHTHPCTQTMFLVDVDIALVTPTMYHPNPQPSANRQHNRLILRSNPYLIIIVHDFAYYFCHNSKHTYCIDDTLLRIAQQSHNATHILLCSIPSGASFALGMDFQFRPHVRARVHLTLRPPTTTKSMSTMLSTMSSVVY